MSKISKVQTYGVATRMDGSKRLTYAVTLPRGDLEAFGIVKGDEFEVSVESKNLIVLRRIERRIVE